MVDADDQLLTPSRPHVHVRILDEVGLISLYHSPLDTKLLCLQRFVRFLAYGGSTLILATYLSELGNSDGQIGLFMTLTLVGDVVISFLLTLFADGLGRKAVLAVGSLLMAASGVVFGYSDNFLALLFAAILGVISPSGNEVGPFRAVEESCLAHLTPLAARSDIYAWYTLIGYAGTAIGTVVAGWIIHRLRETGYDSVSAYRFIFHLYAAIGFIKFLLACALSKAIEADPEEPPSVDEAAPLLGEANEIAAAAAEEEQERDQAHNQKRPRKSFIPTISKEGRIVLTQLCIMFSLDSIGSGIASQSWITYFFKRKFSIDDGLLGSLFSVAAILSALSILPASSIAKRTGNVKAMVFTHLPSGIALAVLPFPPTLAPTVAILFLRSCSMSMDVAPRSAFLAEMISPNERTASMGIINVVKTTSQSLGPLFTGVLASHDLFWVAFVIAGCLKVTYDLGVLAVFTGRKNQKKDESENEETV
ncbi:hypothetical protein MBLNU459_g3067t2 [Dothideomycetes sp. NU459]